MRFKWNYCLIICLLVTATVTPLWTGCWAKEQDSKTQTEKKEDSSQNPENKLIRLESLENSFLDCLRKRQSLAASGLDLQNQLKDIKDKKKEKELKDQLEQVQKNLDSLNLAMSVIFSPSQPYQYEYNPVKSEVFLKVGNLEQVFLRSIQLKEFFLEAVRKKEKALDEEKSKNKKKELQNELDNLKRQHQAVVASLQIVFNVVPQRNYTYNPKDSTLYLKVTEEEAAKIQKKIDDLHKEEEKKKKKGKTNK